MKQWFNSDPEQQKKDRRAAAKEFLEKTITDAEVRKDIIDHPENAWKHFRNHGDIDITKDVKVICVEPDTRKRDQLVVFLLPETTVKPKDLDPLKFWLAAWIPY